MVEQEAVNFEVAGSSPAVGAKIINTKKPFDTMAFLYPTRKALRPTDRNYLI